MKITRVLVDGFKQGPPEYDIHGATVLTGPNGQGKSRCLEAIVYALTGRTPAGRTNDAAALYFPARGGSVQVFDESGAFIRRGIEIDGEKKKVSEIIETSPAGPDGEPDLAPWYASETVLDIREFLALSAAKRREFVLSLCGGGEVTSLDIMTEIIRQYAKEIAGPAATYQTLADPKDLPPEIADLAREFTRSRGVGETLDSYAKPDEKVEAAPHFLKLGEAAKDAKNACRRNAVEAKAALKELEAQAKGARAAAAEVKTLRLKAAQAQEALSAARERVARIEQARVSFTAAETELGQAQAREIDAHAVAEGIKPLPPKPELPALADTTALEENLADAQERLRKWEKEIETGKQVASRFSDAKRNRDAAVSQANKHDVSDLGTVVSIVAEIPDEAHDRIPELRAAVDVLAREWRARRDELIANVEAAVDALEAAGAVDAGNRCHIDAKINSANLLVAAEKAGLSKAKEAAKAARTAYQQSVAEWQKQAGANDKILREVEATYQAAERAHNHYITAQKELAKLGTPPNLGAIESELSKVEAARKAAESAAGALKAYDETKARAEAETRAQTAWSAAEEAIRTASKALVGEAAGPLKADINAILEKAGRSERAYLNLKRRDRPIFELGWQANGATVALEALSGGQAALFMAALALALVKRTEGRKLLLIEADPLDQANLRALLDALGPWAGDLDALIVATARSVNIATGWNVVHLV